MKTRTMAPALSVLAALSALAAPSRAQEATATVNFTARPVSVDGRLDDTAWREASPLTLNTYDGRPVSGGAVARLSWDTRYLYVGADVPDERVVAGRLNRDGLLWEKDDVLEVFLWPREDQPFYYEIVVNPRGTLFDAFFIARPSHDGPELSLPDWNPDIKVATRVQPVLFRPDKVGDPAPGGGWTVEMAIPISALSSRGVNPPGAGESWRVQVVRFNRPDPGPGQLDATSFSAFPDVTRPDSLDRFGRITFAGGPAPIIPPLVPQSGAAATAPTPAFVPVVTAPATPPVVEQPVSTPPDALETPATPPVDGSDATAPDAPVLDPPLLDAPVLDPPVQDAPAPDADETPAPNTPPDGGK